MQVVSREESYLYRGRVAVMVVEAGGGKARPKRSRGAAQTERRCLQLVAKASRMWQWRDDDDGDAKKRQQKRARAQAMPLQMGPKQEGWRSTHPRRSSRRQLNHDHRRQATRRRATCMGWAHTCSTHSRSPAKATLVHSARGAPMRSCKEPPRLYANQWQAAVHPIAGGFVWDAPLSTCSRCQVTPSNHPWSISPQDRPQEGVTLCVLAAFPVVAPTKAGVRKGD